MIPSVLQLELRSSHSASHSNFRDAALAVTSVALTVLASMALLFATPIEVAIPISACLLAGAVLYLFSVSESIPHAYPARTVHVISPPINRHYTTLPARVDPVYIAPVPSIVAAPLHRAPVATEVPTFIPASQPVFHRAPLATTAPTFPPPPLTHSTTFHRAEVGSYPKTGVRRF